MSASFVTLSDGARLAVHTSGQGRDLVLVTGLGGTGAFWQPLAQMLENHFRIIRFDQRGIGQSERGTVAVDIAQLATDTLAVLEHVDAKDALLLGHSTGGVILQDLALRKPQRVAGLILSGTWARPNRYMTELFRSRLVLLDTAPEEYAVMGAFLGYPPSYLEANSATFETVRKAAPKSSVQQKIVAERIAALLAFDRSSEISGITVPTMIQGAKDDLIVPAFLQRELSSLLPKAHLAMLPSGGHFFPESRTQVCAEQLLDWSKSVP